MATETGNTKALCNLTYCIFGLFLALTHMLLARASHGAMCCAADPSYADVSSGFSPRLRQPQGDAQSSWLLSVLLGRQPPPRDCPWCPNLFGGEGQCQAGVTRRDLSSVGFSSPGEGMAHARAVQNFCNEECVERLKQFRDVSKPFSTEPDLTGTYRCLHHCP